ncbi:MAG: FadR family transcriptional regulator [Chloroflexales bacterium]|nr:FadR family transcriptional regulator [Chloroflexales bacterium]
MANNVERANGRSLSMPEHVAQRLLDRIIANDFGPSGVLPSEREIQETYTVSRPVAREAIKLLAARGIVAVHPRQGVTVGTNLTGAAGDALLLAFHRAHAVAEDVLRARMALEPQIAALAAEHATVPQLRELGEFRQLAVMALDDYGRDQNSESLRPERFDDARFHILLAEMSQNPVFKILIEVLIGIFWRQEVAGPRPATPAQLAHAMQQHVAIADAVQGRAATRAQQMMEEHLEFTYSHVAGLHSRLGPPGAAE